MEDTKVGLFNDNFQNYKRYGIPKAQLVIADIPYNLGVNAYASNPTWYEGAIMQMEKVQKQANNSLILIAISK